MGPSRVRADPIHNVGHIKTAKLYYPKLKAPRDKDAYTDLDAKE